MAKEPIIEDEISTELTAAEKKKIEQEARDEVAVQLKASKAKAYKEQAMRKAQAESLLRNAQNEKGEDMVEIDMDIASHPKFITLDGARYHNGKSYTVTKGVAAVLREVMDRGWEEEDRRLNDNIASERQRHRKFMMNRKGETRQVA